MSKKICMITGWEKRDDCWTNIGSPGFVREQKFRGYLVIQRQESSSLSGLKKNSMRVLWHSSSELLRQEGALDTGFIVWGCTDISGGFGSTCIVSEVWESEEGEAGLAWGQSLLHEAICLLCRTEMSCYDIQDVAKELRLDWHTVKTLDKEYMEEQLRRNPAQAPRVIGIDEVSLKRGHTYRIAVSDLERSRPIWFGGIDRSEDSLDMFYQWLGQKKIKKLQLAVMDMWKAFEKSTRKNATKAAILYDKFHVIRHLGEALDTIRKIEYARLSGKDRSYIKGQKYTLLSNRENLTLD